MQVVSPDAFVGINATSDVEAFPWSHGASTMFIALTAPSGFVPGGSKSGRRWSSSCGGGIQGPDCFSNVMFRILCAKYHGNVVIFNFLGSCIKAYVTIQN
jgi:hypothetical protein